MDAQFRLKPFSEACERNRAPILEKLSGIFARPGSVLEIGSGTGQHAVYFARHLPHLAWHPSDLPERHPGIEAWLDESSLPNVVAPRSLDAGAAEWPASRFDYVFSANTAHIMSWEAVCGMFRGCARVLREGGVFALYGPFNRDGQFTSESNQRFDAALRSQDPAMGLRDLQDLEAIAMQNSLNIEQDHAMPANNRLLVFRRI